MTEIIQVRYRNITVGITGTSHKYLEYTNSSGQVFIASGVAANDGPSSLGGFRDSGPSAFVLNTIGFGSGSGSSSNTFGRLATEHGPSISGLFDHRDFGAAPLPSQVVVVGEDLSEDWKRLTAIADQINHEGHRYAMLGKNSNAFVDTALIRSGFRVPDDPPGIDSPGATYIHQPIPPYSIIPDSDFYKFATWPNVGVETGFGLFGLGPFAPSYTGGFRYPEFIGVTPEIIGMPQPVYSGTPATNFQPGNFTPQGGFTVAPSGVPGVSFSGGLRSTLPGKLVTYDPLSTFTGPAVIAPGAFQQFPTYDPYPDSIPTSAFQPSSWTQYEPPYILSSETTPTALPGPFDYFNTSSVPTSWNDTFPVDYAPDVYLTPPIVLDLTGGGIAITELGSSNQYIDAAGDGTKHRTAWAAAGNGVLVITKDGATTADQLTARDFDFTQWDPTATTDIEALSDVFDTNRDRILSATDADWAYFKVLVTNTDGTTTVKTLTELGIASINLSTNTTTTSFADGSQIQGTTTFTRTNGTTGTAATVAFAADANGYTVQPTTVTNADGSTTITLSATRSIVASSSANMRRSAANVVELQASV